MKVLKNIKRLNKNFPIKKKNSFKEVLQLWVVLFLYLSCLSGEGTIDVL